jgi:hypothetical protein
MRLDYFNLQMIARDARAELIERGEIDPGRQRIRKKPRDSAKLELLYRMAIDRLDLYPPSRDEKGRLVLPYFK